MIACLAMVIHLQASREASSGDVEGKVVLPDKPPQKNPRRYPGNRDAEWRKGPAVVFIDRVPGEFAPPKEPVILEQKDRQFSPLALAVLKGSTVEFPNRDDEHHNIFSRSRAKEIELGRYGKDESKSVTFDKPGVVRLRCEVHSNMHAVVVVLENPFFAATDAEGNFAIRRVPAGKYRMYAFHEEHYPRDPQADPLRAVGRDVEVAASGIVRVDFDLRRK